MAYTLPDLPYDFGALEPHIDAQTMEIHHDRHHQKYIDNANDALAGTEWENKPVEEVLRNINQVPDNIRTKVRNNAGGHSNHSIFWEIMSPDGGGEPQGQLANAINDSFGSFKEFRDQFSDAATTLFGSGWAWLVSDGGRVNVIQCPNQDSPYMNGQVPLLGLDVWEHAYYLKYQNKRPDYIDAWWNVVNWNEVERRFSEAR